MVPASTADPPLSAEGPGGAPRRFEFVGGTSSKFWEVSQAGNTMTTRWGRIGSTGQSKTKTYADENSARSAMAALIEEKTGDGYVERT